jgi:hypothetical protein
MVEKSQPIMDIDLGVFLESAGLSFSDAQKALVRGLDIPVNMMLGNSELDLKVVVASDPQGRVTIRPISSQDLSRGGIDPGMLSTLRISYISTVAESKQPSVVSFKPKRNLNDVISEVRTKLKLDTLEKTAGKVEVKPSYVPEKNRWLVTVENAKGKVIREIIMPDSVKETKGVKRKQ